MAGDIKLVVLVIKVEEVDRDSGQRITERSIYDDPNFRYAQIAERNKRDGR